MAANPTTQTPIKHVVVIFFENISFDHYFGTYPFATNPPASRVLPRATIRRRSTASSRPAS